MELDNYKCPFCHANFCDGECVHFEDLEGE